MDAVFTIYGLATLVSVAMLIIAGRRRPQHPVDDGPMPDPSLGDALRTSQPGINNQGML